MDDEIPKLRIPKKTNELPMQMASSYKFKHVYCEMLIEHMAKGLSMASFAGTIDVQRCTLYQWLKKIPEFRTAYELGYVKSMLHWEKIGMAGILGKITNFNSTSWIFTMKNKFKWTDRTDILVSEDVYLESDNEDEMIQAIPRAELYRLIQNAEKNDR